MAENNIEKYLTDFLTLEEQKQASSDKQAAVPMRRSNPTYKMDDQSFFIRGQQT
jgi:hypothetical protein